MKLVWNTVPHIDVWVFCFKCCIRSPALVLPRLPLTTNQLPPTSCHQPNATNQLSPTKLPPTNCHQPTATNKVPPTNCHQPVVSNQLPPTNCHQPVVTNQMPPTNCHQPNCHQPIATNQLPPTKCHQPRVSGKVVNMWGYPVLYIIIFSGLCKGSRPVVSGAFYPEEQLTRVVSRITRSQQTFV